MHRVTKFELTGNEVAEIVAAHVAALHLEPGQRYTATVTVRVTNEAVEMFTVNIKEVE